MQLRPKGPRYGSPGIAVDVRDHARRVSRRRDVMYTSHSAQHEPSPRRQMQHYLGFDHSKPQTFRQAI